MASQSALVSTEWLAERLGAPDLRILDATYMGDPASARAAFEERHIPGAVHVDIDHVADPDAPLPHTLPDGVVFAARMRRLGVGDGNRVVVYDANNYAASARVWWMLRLYGHPDVSVLDGGLAKWLAEGRPVDDRPRQPEERHFTARRNNLLARDLDQMRHNVTARRDQVIDTRSEARFRGAEPEPRPGVRAGHIPGSFNLPFPQLIEPSDRTIRKPEAVRAEMARLGVDLSKPLVATCGSGVTACILALALHEAGRTDVAVYDGSWTEWGGRADTPVAR